MVVEPAIVDARRRLQHHHRAADRRAWSSVNGKFGNADPETKFAFDKALLNVSRFGVTFGGGCSFGHGVNIRGGTATFAMTDTSIR